MPKVSVIIPAYNTEKYIAETLDSVLNQTYTDYEIIVVDDGSKDQTVTIVKQYQGEHPDKIRLIQKENGGPASARNVGIKVATGEYIAFIDADDLWLPEKLEKQVKYYSTKPLQVGMVYTDAVKFDHDGIWNLPRKLRWNRVEGWIYKNLLQGNFIPNQSVMVRRICFDEVGLFDESPEIISSEDYDMWLRIAMKYEILFLNEVLSLYREHAQGINKVFGKSQNSYITVLEKNLKTVAGNIELESAAKIAISKVLYSFGRIYLREGKMVEAREIFNRSLTIRYQLKIVFMKIVTFIPFRVLNLSNKLLKTIYRPPEIVKSMDDLEEITKTNSVSGLLNNMDSE